MEEKITKKAIQVLLENYKEEVRQVRDMALSKAQRRKALNKISAKNRDLIFNLIVLDEDMGEEYSARIKMITSLTLSCGIFTFCFLVISIIFLILQKSGLFFSLLVMLASLLTTCILIKRYNDTLNRYLDIKIQEHAIEM